MAFIAVAALFVGCSSPAADSGADTTAQNDSAQGGTSRYARGPAITYKGKPCDSQSVDQQDKAPIRASEATCYDDSFKPQRQCSSRLESDGAVKFSVQTYESSTDGEWNVSTQSMYFKEETKLTSVDAFAAYTQSKMAQYCGSKLENPEVTGFRERSISLKGFPNCAFNKQLVSGNFGDVWRFICYNPAITVQCIYQLNFHDKTIEASKERYHASHEAEDQFHALEQTFPAPRAFAAAFTDETFEDYVYAWMNQYCPEGRK